MTTATIASTGPTAVPTAPDLTRRGRVEGPADAHQGTALPWFLLAAAVALSLGSNVFAVLQIDPAARSIGGVIYGAWPTCAFLAAAWLWHREGRRGRQGRAWWRGLLVWTLRLAVAAPAAYVSLLHVHATAMHFGQAGAMSWAEAVGMEAVTALALVELDAGHLVRPVVDESQAVIVEDGQAATARERIAEAVRHDLDTTGKVRSARELAEEHGVTRQYAGQIIRDVRELVTA